MENGLSTIDAYKNAIRRTCRLIDLMEKAARSEILTQEERTYLYHREASEQALEDLNINLIKQAAALTALHQKPPY